MLVNGLAFIINLLMVGIQFLLLGGAAMIGAVVSAVIALGFAAAFCSAKFSWHHILVGRISLYVMATAVMFEVAMSGGISGYFSHAIVCLPVMSAYLLGARDTLIFSGFNAFLVGLIIALNEQLPPFAIDPETLFLASSMTMVCTMAAMSLVAIILVNDTEKTDTMLQRMLEHHAYLATHDPLTKLANRAGLSRELGALSARDGSLHVFLIDLDGFKNINDLFGHSAGDDVLVRMAARISNFAKHARIIVRLGGDEFLVVFDHIALNGQAPHVFGERLAKVLFMTHEAAGRSVPVSGSVGGASFPDDATDLNMLLSKADIALYAAKAAGKSVYRAFSPAMLEKPTAQYRSSQMRAFS